MTDSLNGIIAALERQKTAIERALAALRDVEGIPATPSKSMSAPPEAPTQERRKFSAAARRKMALAQKARWAKIKGPVEPATPSTPEPTKRRISPEGLRRIIAATKKRWRLKRAAEKAALAKTVTSDKAAVKKAVVKLPSAKSAKKVSAVRKAAVQKSEPVSTPAPTVALTPTAD